MDEDARLVALLDGELDEDSRAQLLARLAADYDLRNRQEALREAGAPISSAFDALLDAAPVARLRAAIPPEVPHAASGFPSRIPWGALAAGIAIGLLAAGAAVWAALSFVPFRGNEDWRSAVAQYANLYTNETFSPLNPDASLTRTELSAVGARVGANLTPESVALPDLRFTVAFMLAFEGSPLGVIAYVDAEGSPVLLCVIANHAPDAPIRSERRGDLSLAWWSRGGRSHLVIGHMTEERALALAQTLEKRV
jgi:anti-sigma factor RsiW